jgi:hypothetical protein
MAVVNINSPLEDLYTWFVQHPGQREQFLINSTEFTIWYDYRNRQLNLEVDGEFFAWPLPTTWDSWRDWKAAMDALAAFAQCIAEERAFRKDETVQQGVTLMELFEAESC